MPSIATWIRQCDEHWFTDIFSRHLDLTVHNARCHQLDLAQMDALLLTGGGDISLRFLRQQVAMPSLIVDTDCARDEWEFNAVGAMLLAGRPILAICRGLQVLNVAMGGTLHIDIPDHDSAEKRLARRSEGARCSRFASVAIFILNATCQQRLSCWFIRDSILSVQCGAKISTSAARRGPNLSPMQTETSRTG